MIIPLQWAIHTDPAYWHDPLSFKPERFIAEDGSLIKPKAFLPYQTGKFKWENRNLISHDTERTLLFYTMIGKRMCVGDELSRMTLYLFAARILHLFVLSMPSGIRLDLEGEPGITMVPKPHRLIVTPRE